MAASSAASTRCSTCCRSPRSSSAGGWLFRTIGLNRALWLLPSLLFLGASGLALGGGLAAALLLKGTDGALRNSLHRTGTELLFVPLAPGVRSRAKPLVDIVGQRGGQALASVLILSESVLRRGDVVLAAAAAATALVWIALVSELKGLYLDVFRVALREGTLRPALDLPPVDLASLEMLIGALNSADDHEVLAAIDLLAAEGRSRLVPVLILYHPSQAVVLRALHALRARGPDRLRPGGRPAGAARRRRDPRGGAARAHARARRRRCCCGPRPRTRARWCGRRRPWAGWRAAGTRRAALRTLDELAREGDEQTWTALARAIAAQPLPVFEELLLWLADRGAPGTLVQVARAMGALRSPRFLPVLLELLGQREVRGEARQALVAYGSEGLAFVDAALGDSSLPLELRRHLPRTIALFEPQPAAAVLQRRLIEERVGAVRYRMLRGLNRLVSSAGVELDPELLARATRATAEAVFRALHWRGVLEDGAAQQPARATPGHGLLVQLLRDKEGQAIERLLRLLALQYRGEDFRDIHRGLRSRDPRARASGRELLENLLRPPLRGPILAIVGEEKDAVRLAGAGELYAARPLGYEAVLERVLDEGGEALRCIAVYHIGELGLVRLRPRLVELAREATSFFLSRVLERTLATLGREEGLRA